MVNQDKLRQYGHLFGHLIKYSFNPAESNDLLYDKYSLNNLLYDYENLGDLYFIWESLLAKIFTTSLRIFILSSNFLKADAF